MVWTRIIRKMLGRIGEDVSRLGYNLYKLGIDRDYTPYFPCYLTYSPWFGKSFQEAYGQIKDHTVVKEDRCYIIHRLCMHCSHLEGDFAECGVYKGGTAFLIADVLNNSCGANKELHLFDTFAGMPAIANSDPSGHRRGDFGDVSLSVVQDYLDVFPFVVLHPGLIPDTFDAVKDRKFSFVHIDVDLYQTTKDCAVFFYERMVSGGVMVFDDYGFRQYEFAARRAVDEFIDDKPETPISLPTGQCIIIRL